MEGKKKARRQIDWEAIEKEYRAGQLSISAIARAYDVSRAAIQKKAKQKVWKRDLSKKIRQGINAQLVAPEVAPPSREGATVNKGATSAGVDPDASEDEIVNHGIMRGVEIIRDHRARIAKAMQVSDKILDQLLSGKTMITHICENGTVVDIEGYLTPKQTSEYYRSLTQGLAKVIPLERQAFNLDDTAGDTDKPNGITITFNRNLQD
jgi:hypothetical protein